ESLRRMFPPYYSPEIAHMEGLDAMPDRAHNETLDTLVAAGAIGVALELLFFAAVLAGALRVPDPLARAGLVAAAVAHIVEIQFGIATVASRLVLLGIAATIAGHRAEPRKHESTKGTRSSRAAAAA